LKFYSNIASSYFPRQNHIPRWQYTDTRKQKTMLNCFVKELVDLYWVIVLSYWTPPGIVL